jgi:hypothetical protein
VIVATHLALNSCTSGETRCAATQSADQFQEPFSATLLAVSRASSDSDRANDSGGKTARRQKSTSDEAKAPVAVSTGHIDMPAIPLQPTVPLQQVVPVQQTEGTDRDVAALQPFVVSAESKVSLPGADPEGTKAPNVPPADTGNHASNAVGNANPVAPSQTVKGADANIAVNAESDTDARAAQTTIANATQATIPNATQAIVANAAQATIAKAAQNPFSEDASTVILSAEPTPVVHAAPTASAHGAADSKLSARMTDQATPVVSTPDQAMLPPGVSVPGISVDQLVSPAPQSGGSLGTVKAGVPSVNSNSTPNSKTAPAINSKDGSKETTNGPSALKLPTQSASDQTESQAGSQSATPSGDQSQSGASSQGQNTVAVPLSFTSHAAAAFSNAQSTSTVSLAPGSSTHAGVAASDGRTADNAASVATAPLQSPPVINTAKLIQTMSQSEMRVGMHSNEFGAISISTSSVRDLISAQISLDHGELAKVIAAHLPEMQARMGGNQAVDVRIDMNSDKSGQGAGTSGSTARPAPRRTVRLNSRDIRRGAGNNRATQPRAMRAAGLSKGSCRPHRRRR